MGGEKRQRSKLGLGLAGGGFLTAVIIVVVMSMFFNIDWPVILVTLVVVLGVVVGIPAIVRLRKAGGEREDENDTIRPIWEKYYRRKSIDALLADYRAWTEGEHSSYSRIHFGADVIDELRDAKRYEDALDVLHGLDGVKMAARDRYDYDNYRKDCEPQLVEGIEREKRRAVERARNKNLKKKR